MLPDRVKAHFERNKTRYYIGSVVVVAGVTYVIFRRPIIQQGLTNKAGLIIGNQSIITMVDRTGPPSYVVQCMRTGEAWLSQSATAVARGISESDLSMHLNKVPGHDHVNGETYRRLGLAAA